MEAPRPGKPLRRKPTGTRDGGEEHSRALPDDHRLTTVHRIQAFSSTNSNTAHTAQRRQVSIRLVSKSICSSATRRWAGLSPKRALSRCSCWMVMVNSSQRSARRTVSVSSLLSPAVAGFSGVVDICNLLGRGLFFITEPQRCPRIEEFPGMHAHGPRRRLAGGGVVVVPQLRALEPGGVLLQRAKLLLTLRCPPCTLRIKLFLWRRCGRVPLPRLSLACTAIPCSQELL